MQTKQGFWPRAHHITLAKKHGWCVRLGPEEEMGVTEFLTLGFQAALRSRGSLSNGASTGAGNGAPLPDDAHNHTAWRRIDANSKAYCDLAIKDLEDLTRRRS